MRPLFAILIVLLACGAAWANQELTAGATDEYLNFVAVDVNDLHTRETGLSSFAVYYSINGGAATAMTTPTVTELDATNMPGVYKLLVDEAGMTTLGASKDQGNLVLHITQASMDPVTVTAVVQRTKITAGETLTVSGGLISVAGDLLTWLEKIFNNLP